MAGIELQEEVSNEHRDLAALPQKAPGPVSTEPAVSPIKCKIKKVIEDAKGLVSVPGERFMEILPAHSTIALLMESVLGEGERLDKLWVVDEEEPYLWRSRKTDINEVKISTMVTGDSLELWISVISTP